MQEITRKRLELAGWDSNRRIDISEFEERYKKIGIKIPENVKKFLESFGNLEIIFTKQMTNTIVEERISIDPLSIMGDYFDRDYYLELLDEYDINDMVYPIGVSNRGNLLMLMTEENTFYRYTDGFLCMDGKCVDEMLDCVIGEVRLPKFYE